MLRLIPVLALLAGLAPALVAPASAQQLPAGADPANTLLIDTTQGRIVVKLRNDLAPQHAARLKLLAREKFYDNVPFHRVIPAFMAQTGDGQNGNGTGGSKYPDLKAEFPQGPFQPGICGIAPPGNSKDTPQNPVLLMYAAVALLTTPATAIGEVLSGMDV